MTELLFALFAGVLGLTLCFAGYHLARIIIPLWGLFAGFTIGAAGVSDALNNSFIGTTMGILVGIIIGLIFAALAYFFFSLAVVLYAATIGYWLGTGFVLLFGIDKGFLSATVGIVLGAVFAIAALLFNATKYFLIITTAVGGAIVVLGGILLLFNKIQLDAFNYAAASAAVSSSWFFTLIAVVLGAMGIAFQIVTSRTYVLEEWGTANNPKKVTSTLE